MIFTSQYSGSSYKPSEEGRLTRLALEMQGAPAFSESLALETWQSMSEVEQQWRMSSKEYASQEEGRARQEMYWFEQSEVNYFTKLNEYHDQNMDIVLHSEHWRPEERAKIIEFYSKAP